MRRERVERALQSEEHANGSRCHLRFDWQSRIRSLFNAPQNFPPAVRRFPGLRQRQRQRTAGYFDDPPDHPEFGVEIRRVEIGDQFDRAVAGIRKPKRNAGQFRFARPQGRRRIALHRAMIQRSRSGNPKRAGAHRVPCKPSHLRNIVFACRFQLRTALAHDIHPQRAVWQLRADIDVVWHCF